MKQKIMAGAILLLLLPHFSIATLLPLNCSSFSDPAECSEIMYDNSLSMEEKKELIGNLIAPQSKLPNYNAIYNYNKGLVFTTAPEGVPTYEKGIIKDAWLKFLTPSPVVRDENRDKWLVDSSGKILSAYAYRIELPKLNPEPPDCRTKYEYTKPEEKLAIKLNGKQIGNSRETSFSTTEKILNFGADLVISTTLIVYHYPLICTKKKCYCSTVPRIEKRPYVLQISDTFNAEREPFDVKAELSLKDTERFDNLALRLEQSQPVNEVMLEVGGKKFSSSKMAYDVKSMLEPYDVMYFVKIPDKLKSFDDTVELPDTNYESLSNIFDLGLVDATAKCKLRVLTDFSELNLDDKCDLKSEEEAILLIEQGKNFHDADDEVEFKLTATQKSGKAVANEDVEVIIGSKKLKLKTDSSGTASFKAKAKDTKGGITARLKAKGKPAAEASAIVAFAETKDIDTTVSIGSFFSLYYLLFLIVKKAGGVVL